MARGDVIVSNDVDFSVPLHQLLYALAALEQRPGIDILIGERVRMCLRGASRRIFSRAFRRATVEFVGLPREWDTQCGFKVFRREAANQVFAKQSVNGFAFDVEVLLNGLKFGYRTASQKMPWLNDERSTVRPFSVMGRVAADLTRLRLMIGPPGGGQLHRCVVDGATRGRA